MDLGSRLGILRYQDFADTMVVMGQGEGDYREMLRMEGEYGREWKMQFNSSMSKVVNIGK